MRVGGGMIVVISRTVTDAENLKTLIEFMDEPEVRISTPTDWKQDIGGSRLDAVFVGADLTDVEIRSVVDDVGALDPNTQIVMLHEAETP